MSRIGKRAVPVPSGVTANVEGQTVKVKGPKGALQLVLHDDVKAVMDKGGIKVDPRSETKRARSQWGTSRTLINNLITGVTKGFEEKLEITGVGYRAAVQGKNLQLQLGYSHDVVYPIPEGIAIVAPKPTEITITGSDKQKVGQVAAEIRGFRSPEPYKGKGVKYVGEYIVRKEGKQTDRSALGRRSKPGPCAARRLSGAQ
jgi:large subunit ribosomal protein L6